MKSAAGASTLPYGALLAKPPGGEAPKAYMNYVMYDNNFVPITDPNQTNFVQISEAARENGRNGAPERLFAEVEAKQAGYIYIYLSNDNYELQGEQVDVYFDDFTIQQVHSSVVQSDDYYPFGLIFNTYNRENSLLNWHQYNGKEKQNELDLGWIDYGARMYMPEIGRWNGIDPFSDRMRRYSPYVYAFDNPVIFIDPDGRMPEKSERDREKERIESLLSGIGDWRSQLTIETKRRDLSQEVHNFATKALNELGKREGRQGFIDQAKAYIRKHKKSGYKMPQYTYNRLTDEVYGPVNSNDVMLHTSEIVKKYEDQSFLGKVKSMAAVNVYFSEQPSFDEASGVSYKYFYNADYEGVVSSFDKINFQMNDVELSGPAIAFTGGANADLRLAIVFATESDREAFLQTHYVPFIEQGFNYMLKLHPKASNNSE